MGAIVTQKRDIVWNYIGTIFSMAGEFLLLPVLLCFLTPDELGLWYVFIAISKLAALCEFGFSPAFARNIVYVISGSRKLVKTGKNDGAIAPGIDWHLLKTVMEACKLIYGFMAIVSLLLVAVIGTVYVGSIAAAEMNDAHWAAWIVICLSIFLNLYYLRFITYLRGIGDVAGENKAKTVSKLAQLILSAVLLFAGVGLLGAAAGFLVNGVMLRVMCKNQWSSHSDIVEGLGSETLPIKRAELKSALSTISYIAWRDGVVEVSLYASSYATTIVGSLFLSLAETGSYSIMLQLGTAVCLLSGTYMRSFFPAYQSACARGNRDERIHIIERGVSAYLALFVLCSFGVVLVVFPILTLVNHSVCFDIPVFCLLSVYLLLWQQHSLFCSLIISDNEIPYMWSYLITAIVGIALSSLLMGCFRLGLWGLVLGQFVPQLLYNNWRWPKWVVDSLGVSYAGCVAEGFRWWLARLR